MLLLRQLHKTALLAATGFIGDSRLFLLNYALRLLRVALLLSVWRTILGGRGVVSGMTLASVLTYTILGEAFAELLACRTWLESAFWDGTIATRLTRPFGLFGQFAAEMFGPVGFGLCAFSLPLLLAAPRFGVHPFAAGPGALGLFVVSLGLAVSVGLAIEYIFAGVAVVTGMHPHTLNSVRAALSGLLTGALLPLALLPWNLGVIFGWLPFAAQASAPLRIATGTGPAWRLLALQLGWSVILWPVATWLWRVGREKMVAYGG